MREEPVAGKPLEEALVPGQPHPWRDALSVAIQMGRGLQTLHEAGLVHRGVRPDRILVLDSGACRLTDPGPARPETPGPPPAGVDRVSNGTALYMSPEQAVGERVDLRTDIFALGALTYRLLTGHDAFEADGAQRILARILHDRPPQPSRWVAGLPPGVDGVLARALAKQWKDRYADVGSFCDDLDDLLAGRAPRNAGAAPGSLDTWPSLASSCRTAAAITLRPSTMTASPSALRAPVRFERASGAAETTPYVRLNQRDASAVAMPAVISQNIAHGALTTPI